MNDHLSATASQGRLGILATEPPAFRAARSLGSQGSVDRTGGRYGAGLISRVSVITAGEAIGHGLWIDVNFIEQAHAALAAEPNGIKSRWTHPTMSADGLGKLTSRIFSPEKSADGRQLFADQHMLQIGHTSPDGDLAGYLMDLAEEDPSAYGLSIVFYRDETAEAQFALENTVDGVFKSPDPDNALNLPHVRLQSLEAADAVDTPAANPAGLFSRKGDIARDADALAAYALGLVDERPAIASLGLDPVRVRGFATRFMQTHGLELRRKLDAVDERKEAAAFLAAFGEQGACWYAAGVSWDEAWQRHNAGLKNRIVAAEAQLAALALVHGESEPAGFTPSDATATRRGLAGKLRFPAGATPEG